MNLYGITTEQIAGLKAIAARERLTVGDLKRAAMLMGATVEEDAPGVHQVVAPLGKWWFESSGPHLRVDFQNYGHVDAKWRNDAIRDAIRRMQSGLEQAEADE